ncbi:MAG TPA: ribosome biogenesis factor YjgA [Ideonella sp.]|nr:ribosome biogenesis factor YjgA [Ideonella sp.]
MRKAPPPSELPPDLPNDSTDLPAEGWREDERPSKSELKRQSHELQVLGEALSELSEARVAALELPESLLDALHQYRRTRSHEGRRRQLQFIGKVMRQVDPAPIREAVAAARLGSARETLSLHEAERWREELLASDDALTRWINAHPETEPQQLRSLVRAARKDAAAKAGAEADGAERRGRSYRDLFQLIKSALAAAEQAGSSPDDDADGIEQDRG